MNYHIFRLVRWILSFWLVRWYKVDAQIDPAARDMIKRGRPYLMVANHVSWIDGIILGIIIGQPFGSWMWGPHYDRCPKFFKYFGVVPIVPQRMGKVRCAIALARARHALRAHPFVIFPQGAIRREDLYPPWREGYRRILDENTPVIPVSIDGLWGSWFSYKGGFPWKKWPRRGSNRYIHVTVHAPLYNPTSSQLRDLIESEVILDALFRDGL